MFNEKVSIKGRVKFTLYRKNDNVIEFEVPNLVTDIGKELIAERIFRDNLANVATFSSIGVGNSNEIATALDTELQGNLTILKPIESERKSLTGNEIFFNVTFFDNAEDTLSENNTEVAIQEVGLFSSSNELICRTVLNEPFIKFETDLVNVTWGIRIGS